MTFAAQEASAFGGAPVALLEFAYGPNYFRYVNQDEPLVVGVNTYQPTGFQAGKSSGSGSEAGTREIMVFGSNPVAQLFRVQPPSAPVVVVLKEVHTTDSALETRVVFSGEVMDVTWSEAGAVATLVCETLSKGLRRLGPRRPVQVPCPHTLYRSGCNVSSEVYKQTITTFSVSGATVTAPAFTGFTAGYFSGGYIQYINPATSVVERYFVRNHNATTGQLTLNLPPLLLSAVAAFDAFPGCDHRIETCESRFNNLANYGGIVTIPSNNPFITTLF